MTSSSLDETTVRMEFNNEVESQKYREGATIGHFVLHFHPGGIEYNSNF